MKLARTVLAAALSMAWFPASANVLVHVRIATQRMTVSVMVQKHGGARIIVAR